MTERAIIFFDVDGTITDHRFQIPDSATCAIRAARERGNLAVVCSGRPYSHVDPKVKAIGFDGYICSCGMVVRMGEEELLHTSLPGGECRTVIELARQFSVHIIYESEAGMFFDHTMPMNDYMRRSRDHFRAAGLDVEKNVDDPDFTFDKFFCWFDPEEAEPFYRYLVDHFHVIFRGDAFGVRSFEVVARGSSKKSGMDLLLSRLRIPFANTYALGDSTNDLDMLGRVAHGIAMGNAFDEVKAAAEYVTGSVQEDGLKQALEHYGLV